MRRKKTFFHRDKKTQDVELVLAPRADIDGTLLVDGETPKRSTTAEQLDFEHGRSKADCSIPKHANTTVGMKHA